MNYSDPISIEIPTVRKDKIVLSAMLSLKLSLIMHNADLRASKMCRIKKLDRTRQSCINKEWSQRVGDGKNGQIIRNNWKDCHVFL